MACRGPARRPRTGLLPCKFAANRKPLQPFVVTLASTVAPRPQTPSSVGARPYGLPRRLACSLLPLRLLLPGWLALLPAWFLVRVPVLLAPAAWPPRAAWAGLPGLLLYLVWLLSLVWWLLPRYGP